MPPQAHERTIADRVAVVQTICTKLKLTQYSFDTLTAEHVAEVTEHLRTRRKEADTELRKLRVRETFASPGAGRMSLTSRPSSLADDRQGGREPAAR